MTQTEFVQHFGHTFEATPTIAQQAWTNRPFNNFNDLYNKMVAVVKAMSEAEKLTLIRAHPELGAKVKMAKASVKEQTSVGLTQLNAADYQKIQTLNADYQKKFGFPFVVAVKGLSIADIIAAMKYRLNAQRNEEIVRSLNEIYKIAHIRLEERVKQSP